MFSLNKFFVIILIASLAITVIADTPEITDVDNNIVETNPTEGAVLTQLRSTASDLKYPSYTYKCTVGSPPSNRVACNVRDNISWATPHNIELRLRCPRIGFGPRLSGAEIIYSTSSASTNCFVHEGAVGLGSLGLTVKSWNTQKFSYTANFYAY